MQNKKQNEIQNNTQNGIQNEIKYKYLGGKVPIDIYTKIKIAATRRNEKMATAICKAAELYIQQTKEEIQ